MGQFIDTQQGLLSEAKHKRLEREAAKKEKERLQRLEMELYNILDSYFSDDLINKIEYKEQYVRLSHARNKHRIINELTKDDKEVYYLEKKYNTLLNNVYNGYKTYWNERYKNNDKQYSKQLEIKLHRTLQNTLERKQLHTKKRKLLLSNSGRGLLISTRANYKKSYFKDFDGWHRRTIQVRQKIRVYFRQLIQTI